MAKKTIILFIILIGLSTLLKCSITEKDKVGVVGYIANESGDPLGNVSVFYKNEPISVQTDATGSYIINKPRTLFIEFKKEGYETVSTKIDDFSEESSYDLKTIVLKKTTSKQTEYKAVLLNVKPHKLQSLQLSGKVVTIFNTPIKDVKITLTDAIKRSAASRNQEHKKGFFYFRKHNNELSFEKNGFKNVLIDVPISEKNSQNITLLDTSDKKGIYIIKSGKYIPLPLTKLSQKSEEKIGRILWGGNYSYKITAFFYPDNTKEFKIKKDTLLRFVIFDPDASKYLFKAKTSDGYLCTVDYKSSFTSYPKGNSVAIKTIYPSKYRKIGLKKPVVIEFKPDTTGVNYAFINSKNKKGYYFRY